MQTEKDDPINRMLFSSFIITRIMKGIARKKMSMTSVYAIPPTPTTNRKK